MRRELDNNTNTAIVLFVTLTAISFVAGLSVIMDLFNQLFLFRTIIHWINFCSAIFSIIFLLARVNSKIIFTLATTLSAHQFYFLEKMTGRPHYNIFPDIASYFNNAQDLLSNPTKFTQLSELGDLGFTAIIAFLSTIFSNVDLINYSLLILNLLSISISYILIESLFNATQRNKRLISVIILFFPGMQIFPAFMLKESIFCLILSVVIYLYFKRKPKSLIIFFNTLIIFFRPVYSMIFMVFLTLRRKLYIILLFPIGFLLIFDTTLPSFMWMYAIANELYATLSFDVIISNFILAFLFPFPAMPNEGILLSAVYSYGSVVFYTFLPLYVSTFFTNKFPSELKFIYIFISSAMFILGIGVFRAKIVLMPVYMILLLSAVTNKSSNRLPRILLSYVMMITFLLILFESNF